MYTYAMITYLISYILNLQEKQSKQGIRCEEAISKNLKT